MGPLQAQSPMLLAFFLTNCVSSCEILGVDRRRSRSIERTPSPLKATGKDRMTRLLEDVEEMDIPLAEALSINQHALGEDWLSLGATDS
jgi:hypothetical protein